MMIKRTKKQIKTSALIKVNSQYRQLHVVPPGCGAVGIAKEDGPVMSVAALGIAVDKGPVGSVYAVGMSVDDTAEVDAPQCCL